MKPKEDSSALKLEDADGLLLDGRPVLFDSTRTDLGGGQIFHSGAIKVCNLGTMTISDGIAPAYVMKVEISTSGFICPDDSAGYKDTEWCVKHPGWDIRTASEARGC